MMTTHRIILRCASPVDLRTQATKRRRVAFGEAAPALATMDGSLHALPSKPAPGLDDMDGSLYNLRAFG